MKRINVVFFIILLIMAAATFICLFDMLSNTFGTDRMMVVFNSGGKKISGTFVQGDAHAEKGIILLHDEGADRTSMTALASAFNKEGYSVMYYDLPGHGNTEGSFYTEYYTGVYLEDTLESAVDKFITVTGLETADIAFLGDGLGARVVLKYAEMTSGAKQLYLIKPYTAKTDENLVNDTLMKVGKRDTIFLLYPKMDKEYCDYLAPQLFEGLTNETLDKEQTRNVNANGNIEFNRLDYSIPGMEENSNSYIKKIIFKASIINGFDLQSDYFNLRSMMFFLVMMMLMLSMILLSKTFNPTLKVSKKEKSPYAFGIVRLLLSLIVIGIYIVFRFFFGGRLIYQINPLYDGILVVFAAYAVTGLHELKYRKVVHMGDSSLNGATAFTVGFLITAGVVLWALNGMCGFYIFKERLFYVGLSVVLSWFAFYFFSLEFSVMYMKGASERGQRFLVRLIFLLPFITMFLVAYLSGGNDYRLIVQLLLIWLCLFYAEGLQRLGNNLIVSASFPALLYGVMTVAFSMVVA